MRGSKALVEIAWEICNQVGGIYTVLRSKAPEARKHWKDDYCLVGPWFKEKALGEFEEEDLDNSIFAKAVQKLRDKGIDAKFGRWLVAGRPRVVLLNLESIDWQKPLSDVNHFLKINTNTHQMVRETTVFSFLAQMFAGIVAGEVPNKKVIAHFHEWMSSAAVGLLKSVPNVKTICSTHATLLGRYLAMSEHNFYDDLPHYNWEQKAAQYNVAVEARLERQAAHNCDVFTTLSSATDRECEVFLGRRADVLLPNGLNIQRFTALHEFQNLHLAFKKKIHQFTISHFFQNYTFDLDKTLYFFTSGRYEYRNKGFDLTIAALSELNQKLRSIDSQVTVICFFVTQSAYDSINPEILESRSLMAELNRLCGSMFAGAKEEFFNRLVAASDGTVPDINDVFPDATLLRLRRTILHWKREQLPKIITHNLKHDGEDPLLNDLRRFNLINHPADRVKVVYHPDFINSTNPLFNMDYHEFVRGCHLGVFPSYYEPWGYTPLEAIASGIPTVTSDLAGFGTYLQEHIRENRRKPVEIIERYHRDFWDSTQQLAEAMFRFCKLSRRERIALRNQTEELSAAFDWNKLYRYYKVAYRKALQG